MSIGTGLVSPEKLDSDKTRHSGESSSVQSSQGEPQRSLASTSPREYYRPDKTPLFKTLQKTRLTKTRTKQLLCAAEREYDNPPPPPGLGDCCGSSCDPCVRDLWGEEIGVWRERWGHWAEEKQDREESVREDKVKSRGVKQSRQKELEW